MEDDLRESSPVLCGKMSEGPRSQELRVSFYARTHARLWGLRTSGGGHGSWSEPFTRHHESGCQDAEM